MNHPDFPSGAWTGFYNYEAGGRRHHTDLTLTFVAGILAGQGSDRVGVFGIAGRYDSMLGELEWTKTYFGAHSVRYRGFADGLTIWGTWKIGDIAKGGFHIWPVGFFSQALENRGKAKGTPPLRLSARKSVR